MAYCTEADLLLGQIPLPTYISATAKINDAADEIDSMIGFTYVTPIDVADTSTVPRPVRLILKRLNSHLASGRLILELASSQEDRQLHAYGWSLIEQANATLRQISTGEIIIEGAERLPDTGAQVGYDDKILQYNKDSFSQVDAFYDTVTNPSVQVLPPYHQGLFQ